MKVPEYCAIRTFFSADLPAAFVSETMKAISVGEVAPTTLSFGDLSQQHQMQSIRHLFYLHRFSCFLIVPKGTFVGDLLDCAALSSALSHA